MFANRLVVVPAPVPRAAARVLTLLTRPSLFAVVGGIAFLVDLGVYNLLRADVLADKPIGAKVISVAVATTVAWLGNRYLAFRDSRRRSGWTEAALFGVANVLGLGIAAACLFTSHYVLGLTSTLADNISGNVVGLVLGTSFRYAMYRWVVFRPFLPSPARATHPEVTP